MMTECMRWLYDHYILPQIEGRPMDDGDAFRAALFWDALDQEQARDARTRGSGWGSRPVWPWVGSWRGELRPAGIYEGPETAVGAHTVRPSPLCGMFSAYP